MYVIGTSRRKHGINGDDLKSIVILRYTTIPKASIGHSQFIYSVLGNSP